MPIGRSENMRECPQTVSCTVPNCESAQFQWILSDIPTEKAKPGQGSVFVQGVVPGMVDWVVRVRFAYRPRPSSDRNKAHLLPKKRECSPALRHEVANKVCTKVWYKRACLCSPRTYISAPPKEAQKVACSLPKG